MSHQTKATEVLKNQITHRVMFRVVSDSLSAFTSFLAVNYFI